MWLVFGFNYLLSDINRRVFACAAMRLSLVAFVAKATQGFLDASANVMLRLPKARPRIHTLVIEVSTHLFLHLKEEPKM